jgi:hypothetical protein
MTIPDRTLDALTEGRRGFVFNEDGTWAGADGRAAVDLYRLLVIQSALKFEIKTGMKMSRHSALKAANSVLGASHRRKQAALDHLTAVLDAAKGAGIE